MALMTNIYEKARYVAPYEWLINMNIQEWDLAKANISILRSLNLISEDQYQSYLVMPKQNREVAIGCLRRDNPNIEAGYQQGIVMARQLFFDINSIEQENVLYIDNDSITTVHSWNDRRAGYIRGEINPYLNFRIKNRYTSLYRINEIDFLYFSDGTSEKYRLKNINQERIESTHSGYFLDFLLATAYSVQRYGILDSLNMIKETYKKYVNRELPIQYYREFNSGNRYKVASTPNYIYYSDIGADINTVDIYHNSSIIRLFYKILMKEYFRQIKKNPRT
jgi:hypothetical protein